MRAGPTSPAVGHTCTSGPYRTHTKTTYAQEPSICVCQMLADNLSLAFESDLGSFALHFCFLTPLQILNQTSSIFQHKKQGDNPPKKRKNFI